MALPQITDVAATHLFSDRDKMIAAGIPEPTMRHLERLRDVYNYWLAYPSKRDRDIVAELRTRYGLGESMAREDLRTIKTLLGDLQRVTKDYMRFRVTQMLERAYEKAAAANNTRDMVAAAKALTDVHKLDKDDERANIIDRVVPIILSFTDDPTVIGLPRLPDFRRRIKEAKEKYWVESVEDVEGEDIDAGLDELFKPQLPPTYGTSAPTGIS